MPDQLIHARIHLPRSGHSHYQIPLPGQPVQ